MIMRRLICFSGALFLCSACTSTVQSEPPRTREAETPPSTAEGATAAEAVEEVAPQDAPATPPQEPPAQDDSQFQWTIEVEPDPMRMDQRSECRVRLSVTNTGTEAAGPPLPHGLTVNGQPSMVLTMAFGNGAMGPRWMSLPPGETVSTERAGCEHYFEAPGEYIIGFPQGGADLTTTLRIIP